MFKTNHKPRKIDSLGKSPGVVKPLKQTGEFIDIPRDRGRKAMLPGQRISKSGEIYWETRKNRSDAANKRI